jgi:hypothetical protein
MWHALPAQDGVQPGRGGRPSALHELDRARRRPRWCRTPTGHRWMSSRMRRTSSSVSTAPSTLPSIGSPSLVSIERWCRRTGSIRRPFPSGINSSCVSGVMPRARRSAFGITTRPTRSIVTYTKQFYHLIGKMPAPYHLPGLQGVRLGLFAVDSRARSQIVGEPYLPSDGRSTFEISGWRIAPTAIKTFSTRSAILSTVGLCIAAAVLVWLTVRSERLNEPVGEA